MMDIGEYLSVFSLLGTSLHLTFPLGTGDNIHRRDRQHPTVPADPVEQRFEPGHKSSTAMSSMSKKGGGFPSSVANQEHHSDAHFSLRGCGQHRGTAVEQPRRWPDWVAHAVISRGQLPDQHHRPPDGHRAGR